MLRIATIGTSMITDDFIQVVNANDQAAFVGTLSRDANRGAAFTAERGGERNFTSLDELAAAADVDAVYIGSPNALHYEQALACIAGGKHVIVEKPFCATEAQALEVFRAAEAAGVVALEAMRPLHDPAFHAIEDALGEIAPIRRASLRFGKYSSRYNEILAGRATNIFDCNMASGSLMDIGVYTVEPMVEIFGMPSGLTSMTTLLDPTTRQLTHGPIDGCGSILASYGGGRISAALADRRRAWHYPDRPSVHAPQRPHRLSRRRRTRLGDRGAARTGRQRPRARPAQIEQHYGIRTHRLHHRHRRHR